MTRQAQLDENRRAGLEAFLRFVHFYVTIAELDSKAISSLYFTALISFVLILHMS